MLLIDCKVNLELKWKRYLVLSVGGNDNTDTNIDNIVYTIKTQKYSHFISKR